MQLALRKLPALVLISTLSACAALVPDSYLISQQKLADSVYRKFPLKRELANGMLSVTLEAPALVPDVAHNRITLSSRLSAYTILGGAMQGELKFSSALRFDADQRAIFLREPQLDSLTFTQEQDHADMLRPVLNMLLLEYLGAYPLYNFQAKELRYAGTDIDISAIEVVADGLRLKLKPRRSGQ